MAEEDRRAVGALANEVREALQSAAAERLAALRAVAEEALLAADRLDLSLPGRRPRRGSLHPISLADRGRDRLLCPAWDDPHRRVGLKQNGLRENRGGYRSIVG